MSENISEGSAPILGFRVEYERRDWERYGILERVGQFSENPKQYKILTLKDGPFVQNIVKSPGFLPVPNQVASEIAHHLAGEFGLAVQKEKGQASNLERYYAVLTGEQRGQVEVGDYVTWGLVLENNPTGSFRMRTFLLRLRCTNGMTVPEEPELMDVKKSHVIQEMYENAKKLAELKKEKFEAKLEFFKTLKTYKLNAELAQILAKHFPAPILAPSVTVKREEGVPVVVSYQDKDLWSVYNDLTYNISHRDLKLSTQVQWTEEATMVLKEWISHAGDRS